jgi:hypothetical protein
MVAFFFRMLAVEFDQRRIRIVFHRGFVHAVSGARVGALVAEVVRRGDLDDVAAREPEIKVRCSELGN